MGRRRGELSSGTIDREYPHQVIVPWSVLSGGYYNFIRYFCEGLSVAPRGHSIVKDDEWHYVFCFRDKADAEKFQTRFGGERFDPATRGRGSRWHLLRDVKKRYY
jgi:hypothetical protein